MELREALIQISEIRLRMARTEVFRGYRAVPVAFSGLLALAAAGFQAVWIPDPAAQRPAYLALWLGTAALSALGAGTEMPCLVAGALLTFVLVRHAPEAVGMLPGLWQVLFSLGIFASHRLLPRAIVWVAVWYLAAGLTCLAWARGSAAFSPWAMGLPFGAGQLLAAAVLYWMLERNDDES
jgi:hypothetical protein